MAAIAGVLDRPRLYSILNSELVRVCVVSGPSGAGKTTLLRSWALQRQERSPVVWVSLDEGIPTRQVFWQHVVASAERLGMFSRETAEQLRRQLSVSVDPVRIARGVLAAAGPVVLVVDAYEHLGEVAREVDDDLARLLSAVPALRVMITTRAETALSDVTLADGAVRVITLRELAFTAREVEQLIAEQAGIDDGRLAASVTGVTRGFPLTVRAVTLAIAQLGRIPRADSSEWDRVAAAKLEGLLPDAAAAQFVTDTSVPPYIDEDLATRLSGNPDASRLLRLLEQNGFGRWIPYARDRPVFQYVETIRDTFRARAAVDGERFRRSCRTSAQWLLENEHVVDQALQFAIEAGDYALADRVFVAVVISNPDAYITGRFLSPLQKVPDAALEQYPMLAFGLGLALMTNPLLRLEAPRVFRIAVESSAHPPYLEPSIDAVSHASMRAISRRLAFDYPASAQASLAAARQIETLDPAMRDRYAEHLGTILRQLSFSIWQGGYIEEAIAAAARSVALCTTPASRTYSMVYGAAINAFAGDTVQAGELVAAIDEKAWPAETRKTSLNGMGLLAEAYVRMDEFDFAGAAEVLSESGTNMRASEYWPFLTAAGVIVRHGLGHGRAEAERVTRELDAPDAPPGVGDNAGTEQLYGLLALTWLAAGDHRAAGRLLEPRRGDSPYLAAAHVATLLAAGRDTAALELAERGLEFPRHTIRTRAETQLIGAVAALRQDAQELAWEWLSAAVVAGETYGARLHVAFLHPRDRRMLWEFARARGAASVQDYLDVPAGAAGVSRRVELSGREQIVLGALAAHDSIRGVAQSLSVSPHTIKTQLQSIYRKLGVSSRQSALEAGRELGLLPGIQEPR